MRSTKPTMIGYASKLEKLILADCEGKKYESTRQWYAEELVPLLDRIRSEALSVAGSHVSEPVKTTKRRKRSSKSNVSDTFHKYYDSDVINFQLGLESCLKSSVDALQATFSECSYDWFTFRYVEYPSPRKDDGSKYFKLWQAPGWIASLCLCCCRAQRTKTLLDLSEEVHGWIDSSRESYDNGKVTTYATPSLLTKKVMTSDSFLEEDVKLAQSLWSWMCNTFASQDGVSLYPDQLTQRLESLKLFSDDKSNVTASQEE